MEANYYKQFRQKLRRVWFSETTAPVEGYGVCYDPNYIGPETGAAVTDVDKRRGKVVQNPSATNNKHFAGIISGQGSPYVADANGQFVTIVEEGATMVHMGNASATIEDILTCDTGDEAGQFLNRGYKGRGNVSLLQTVTAEGLCPALLHKGNQSGLVYTWTPPTAGGAVVLPPTGLVVCKASALDTAHVTYTLADGLQIGEEWGAHIVGDLVDTYDLVLTITSSVKMLDDSTAAGTLTGDDIGDMCYFKWLGDKWSLLHNVGFVIS